MAYDFKKREVSPADGGQLTEWIGLPHGAVEHWQADQTLRWMPVRGLEVLSACFDMESEALRAGERRESGGRIGYLLQGALQIRERGADRRAAPGTLLGVRRDSRGRKVMVPAEITAEEDAVVIWWQFDVVQTVCYQACWFHARLIRELEGLIRQDTEQAGGKT